MGLEIPQLANKSYNDLIEELITSVPKFSENWTNLNPSEPGVTLLELMAYAGEGLLFKADRITLDSYVYFLRLVSGVNGLGKVEEHLNIASGAIQGPSKCGQDRSHEKLLRFQYEIELKFRKKTLDEKLPNQDNVLYSALSRNQPVRALDWDDIPQIKKHIREFTQSRYRAVTRNDFEELALEATENRPAGSSAKVARAIIEESNQKAGKIWIRLVSDSRFEYELPELPTLKTFRYGDKWTMNRKIQSIDFSSMLNTVSSYLEPRKLIGTPIETSLVSFTPLSVTVTVHFSSITSAVKALPLIMNVIQKLLDPIEGGDDKKGWTYMRPVSIYEISQMIENVSGVDHISELILTDSSGNAHEQLAIAGLPRLDAFTIKAEAVEREAIL